MGSIPIGHPKQFCERFILAQHGRSMHSAVNREIKVRVLTPEPRMSGEMVYTAGLESVASKEA